LQRKSPVFKYNQYKAAIVMIAAFLILTLGAAGALYFELCRQTAVIKTLAEENIRLKVYKSTREKMLLYKQPGDREKSVVKTAADEFLVAPEILWALRRTENGRYLYEFGCSTYAARIREKYPVELWQYYQAAYLVARGQGLFCLNHRQEFIKFLSQTYPHPDERKAWESNMLRYSNPGVF
jgi:hypothetical protein